MEGKVSIVGAGPGDPDLLTVKAVRRIREAQVVLHDSLVSSAVLALTMANEIINVGRRYGEPRDQTQRRQRIHALMLEHTLAGRHVVRLKSGDPLLYGRTAEDVQFLTSNDISYEIVPGISAGMGAASLLNIPLTERYKSSAVLTCTGHTANHDVEALERLGRILGEGTPLVMYMGAKSLETIVSVFSRFCNPQEVWVTAVSNVSLPEERWIAAPLIEIAKRLQQEPLPLPVVMIFGKYARPVLANPDADAQVQDPRQDTHA